MYVHILNKITQIFISQMHYLTCLELCLPFSCPFELLLTPPTFLYLHPNICLFLSTLFFLRNRQLPLWLSLHQYFSLISATTDTLLNVFLAIAVDNLANAQELTKVQDQTIQNTFSPLF